MELPTLLFEQHPTPMIIFDIDTLEIIAVNKSAVKKYGFSEEEFLQITLEDIRPPEDIPHFRKLLQETQSTSKVSDLGTLRHQTKEGKILYVQVTGQNFPVKNRNARLVHIHDITETVRLRKKVEDAYRDQEHHIDNNPLGMIKYDKNFRIIEWSSRAEEKTGYSKDEMLGKVLFDLDLIPQENTEKVKNRLLQLSSGEKDRDRFETVIKTKNGVRMEVLIHSSASRNRDGELKSVLAFIENITDRKNYERELEKREKKYHRLFEEANDGIFLMNNFTFIDCNQRITELFDAPKEEIIGKTPLDFSPDVQPDGSKSEEKARKKVKLANKGEPQVFEWKHLTPKGEEIDVEVSLNKIDWEQNGYIQAIIRDLTEHNEVKNKLMAEQQRLKHAQRLANLGWWNYQTKEDKVIWSDVLFDILDVKKTNFEATFEAFNKLVHPEDREKLSEVMKELEQSPEPLDYILRIGTREKFIYANCRAQSKFNQEGELVSVSGIMQNITDQMQAQNELQYREKLFESLFVDSPEAIAMIDPDGTIQKVNRSYEKLFGYSEEELLGKDLLKHQLPEERYDEIDKIYSHVFDNKDHSKYYEDRRITKEGEIKHLLVGALPVIIDGKTIAAFGIYTDITKLRKTEKNLTQSLKEKEVLLSEIHHRVKNNLAIISGLLELEAMNWRQHTNVYNVLTQSRLRVHSMAHIHEKLYHSQDFANLDLENYISELVDYIYRSMEGDQNNVNIFVHCDDVSLNINQAVPCALIVNELVTNAFKYAFDKSGKGNLKVTFEHDDGTITIVVEDDGPGLPNNFKSMTKESLGHQLVNQLVKQLQGSINVETAKAEGTRYEITFEKASKRGSASSHFQ